MEETKIIYYIDDDKMPYLIKLNMAPDQATLKDFRNSLNTNGRLYKYFFQTIVDDFGVVKEEIADENTKLPCVNGRVVCWLITIEGSVTGSDIANNNDERLQQQQQHYQNSNNNIENMDKMNRMSSSGNTNNTSGNRKALKDLNMDDTTTETESLVSAFDQMKMPRSSSHHHVRRSFKTSSSHQSSSITKHHKHQKLSLDSHARNAPHQHHQHHHHNYQQNYLMNHHRHGKKDSFSDDHDDSSLNDDTTMNDDGTEINAPSIVSSNLDTTTFFDDTEDDGQFSSITTETTNSTMSSRRYGINRNRRRMRHKINYSRNSLHSSVTSLADSTMSLNIITVTLDMNTVNFLGISIVGQSNKAGEGGIYVGSIMNGGAVALDGRIEPGDMILQVNDISFEHMSNDDAVRVLREAVTKPGPIKLVVAKCWDPNPQGYFTVAKNEPIRPIDPSAWVANTQAHNGQVGNNPLMHKRPNNKMNHSISSFGSTLSLTSTIADSTVSTTYNNAIGGFNYYNNNHHVNNLGCTTMTSNGDNTKFGNEHLNLTINTDMETVARAMAAQDSGLDVRDRNWLKITIPNAFIGSDVVDWLFNHVEGFPDRRDARKYACNMLKHGYIRHAVNKLRFSEQCYYIFGDQSTWNTQLYSGNLFTLNEESEADFDSVSEIDRDSIYAPMNYQMPQMGGGGGIYQYQKPKLYSNLNGIGGPPPPPSYISSSSSNATSNSTSTTSNNTTLATNTTALGGGGVGMTNTTFNSTSNGILSTERSNPCQFYYPPPSIQMTPFHETTQSTSMFKSTINQDEDTINQTNYTENNTTNINSTYNPPNSMLSQSQFSTTYASSAYQNSNMPSSVYNNSSMQSHQTNHKFQKIF